MVEAFDLDKLLARFPGPRHVESSTTDRGWSVLANDGDSDGHSIVAKKLTEGVARLLAQAPAMHLAITVIIEQPEASELQPHHYIALKESLT